jgi:hypothetical protein
MGEVAAVAPPVADPAVVAGGWVTTTEVVGSVPVQAASRGAARARRMTWRSGDVFISLTRAARTTVVRGG